MIKKNIYIYIQRFFQDEKERRFCNYINYLEETKRFFTYIFYNLTCTRK